MRKEQFIEFIDAPAIQQEESVALLSQLTKQFPYCQTAQLLLAKALHNQNSIRYSDQLKVAAAYASDRKVLYQLIMSKAPVEIPVTSRKEETPAVPLAIPENDTELLNNLVASAETDLENQKNETLETLKAETQKEETLEILKNETLETQKVETLETPKVETLEIQKEETPGTQEPEAVNVEELPLLERNILVEAIDASIELEVSENMPFRETEDITEEEKTVNETAKTPINTESAGEETEEEFDPNKVYSFSEWLRLSKKLKAKGDQTGKTAKQEENKADTDEKEQTPAKRKTLDDLIDKFITEEPKISRPSAKQDFFSPVNMARQSVQDDNEFVTETLANIYLKQGSFAKALKAYETLSLKFPEKKLYFAARIKEIKKIIKEQK